MGWVGLWYALSQGVIGMNYDPHVSIIIMMMICNYHHHDDDNDYEYDDINHTYIHAFHQLSSASG
jgi:hypothetical protein